MHKLKKSDKAIFSRNRFVGWSRRSLFFKMIMMIEAFAAMPNSIMRNITGKNQIHRRHYFYILRSANITTHIKLRHYEKATKLEKISHLFWQNSCFYSVVSKEEEYFSKFLWPSQKSWTLIVVASHIWE